MSMDKQRQLIEIILSGDVLGAMTYLKNSYGVSEGFICNKANVNLSTYSRYKKGEIKILGADKKDALINTVKEIYL